MNNNPHNNIDPPFQSGAMIRLPPREFLKRLPVRVSHLMFEIESNSEKWKDLKKKLFKSCEPFDTKNEPIYFLKTEHEDGFQCFDTNDYFEEFDLPPGAVWVVRFEKHIHFVSFSFHRYFESSCKSITGGGARDFLKTLDYEDHDINELLKRTIPGGNIDLAVVPKGFKSDKPPKSLLELDVESHYVTKSHVFDGMAEVLMSFQIDKNKPENPRPVIIRELKDMSARAAGEVIQILLQIEAYRLMASRRIPHEYLRDILDSLENYEQYFVNVSDVCQATISKKPNLLKDLIIVEDYLPIQTALAKIALKIDHETAKHARQYDTAQAYSNLALDRLDDLREQRVGQEPTIKIFLRHRLKQVEQTYKAIGQRQDCLSRQISQLDGLMRSRMEARQSFSVHCVHFMILGLTILAVLYYLPQVIERLKQAMTLLSWTSPILISLVLLFSIAILLSFIKTRGRKKIKDEIEKAEKTTE